MRTALVLVLLVLTGCATPPRTTSSTYFHGVYAPGEATIADDGSFVSTSKVASADKMDIAGEAALKRLLVAAEARGMTYAVVSSVDTGEGANGYRIEGHVFRAGEAPSGAVALQEIELALRQHLGMVPKRPRRPAMPTPASASSGVIEQREEPGNEPIVIRAPDFVT